MQALGLAASARLFAFSASYRVCVDFSDRSLARVCCSLAPNLISHLRRHRVGRQTGQHFQRAARKEANRPLAGPLGRAGPARASQPRWNPMSWPINHQVRAALVAAQELGPARLSSGDGYSSEAKIALVLSLVLALGLDGLQQDETSRGREREVGELVFCWW